jgi:LacI family transcriptional regulator
VATTLKDISQKVGLHPATVSRALNPRTSHLVHPNTVARIRKVAEAMNYAPNPMAAGLRTARSHTVGVVIPDLTNPLFPGIVRGIQDVLAPSGYTPLLVNTDNAPDVEATVVGSLRARRVDGFILATARREHPLLVELASQVPVVLVNRVSESITLPSVSADDKHGILLAVDHLVGLGHREIGHVAGPTWSSTGHERALAFARGMREHGLSSARRVAATDAWNVDAARVTAAQLLRANPTMTAVVAANDQLALGTVSAARELKRRCPTDFSVVGFNDMPFMDLVDPPLTTIRVPKYGIGAEAARLLLSLLLEVSPTSVKQVMLTPELVVRGSTRKRRPARG